VKDRFDEIMEQFLCPLSRLEGGRATDSLYFLRKDGCFVFTEGYCHPEGGLYGKIIYYPCPGGGVDIFGREYGCTTKRKVGDEIIYVSHPEQIKMHGEIDPVLDPAAPRPIFVEYEMEFPLSDFIGFFDPAHSLRSCMNLYGWVGEGTRMTSRVLDVPLSDLGVTGSLAYGRYEEGDDDLDLVIRGTSEDNRRVYRKIRELSAQPEHMVVEFGRWWPMRFYEKDLLVCPFFIYDRWESAPLRDFRLKVLREEVPLEGVVADDTHTIYMPPLLLLEDVRMDGQKASSLPLIIYDGALRGEFFRGDILRMNARLVEVTQGADMYQGVLVTLWDDIRKVGETHF
jgi:predicted nucleotidyltransferase